jgi:hypothetical protein
MSENQGGTREQETAKHFYRASAVDFKQIPGNAIVYWASKAIYNAFANGRPLTAIGKPVVGLQTGENARFVRGWHEVAADALGFSMASRLEAKKTQKNGFRITKAGTSVSGMETKSSSLIGKRWA